MHQPVALHTTIHTCPPIANPIYQTAFCEHLTCPAYTDVAHHRVCGIQHLHTQHHTLFTKKSSRPTEHACSATVGFCFIQQLATILLCKTRRVLQQCFYLHITTHLPITTPKHQLNSWAMHWKYGCMHSYITFAHAHSRAHTHTHTQLHAHTHSTT